MCPPATIHTNPMTDAAQSNHLGPAATASGVWEDILEPDLDVVFVGFNPSLVAWRTGHYYANPGNRFYALLHEGGLTPHRLRPDEDRMLPSFGIGVTDLVHRPSGGAHEIPSKEFRAGVAMLRAKLERFAPTVVCCNGVAVFRYMFGTTPVGLGRQPAQRLGASDVFVVPSSSGRVNGRSTQRLAAYRELALWLNEVRSGSTPAR